jgi:hypothetical protein
MFFSKEGFALDASKTAWLGWVLAGIGTIVELVFNSKANKLSLTLIVVGILFYMYGTYTNIIGFWDYQNPGIAFAFTQKSLLAVFVGTILEILPEPLFMWGMMAEFEGDVLGNLAALFSGDVTYNQPKNNTPQSFNNDSVSTNPFKPNTEQFKPKPKPVPFQPVWPPKKPNEHNRPNFKK